MSLFDRQRPSAQLIQVFFGWCILCCAAFSRCTHRSGEYGGLQTDGGSSIAVIVLVLQTGEASSPGTAVQP